MTYLYIGSNGQVAAIDTSNGKEKWRTKLDTGGGIFSATTRQDVSILDHEDKVFAGSNGHVFCLDAKGGRILWHNKLPKLGHNDVMLSIAGRSTQIITRTEKHS